MADVSITQLNDLAPSTNTYVPISNGSTTGRAIYNPVPVGGIIMWSGSVATIPTGWALCNGQNGTPDLRDRFIVGAGTTYNPGNIGGLSAVQLTIDEMPKHNHGIAGSYWAGTGPGGSFTYGYYGNFGTAGQDQGGDKAHENRPPYYALAYIMRTI